MPLAIQDIKMIIPDSKKNSFNISPKQFLNSITSKTKAAVLTHLGGHPIDMDPIMNIAKKNNIKINEFPVKWYDRNAGIAKGGGSFKLKISLTFRTIKFMYNLKKKFF